ncbi:MAG: metallophosphoesterase family protein [Kiritimatiellia bacterium]
MTRRNFLWSGLSLAASALTPGNSPAGDAPRFDERLAVLLSDIHVNGLERYPDGDRKGKSIKRLMRERLRKTVDEILSMDPRPRHVFVFGDIAYLNGRDCDYSRAKPELRRLTDAGIALTLGLGNHDHRAAFFDAWPEYRERTLLKDHVVTATRMPDVDLIMLDSLDDNGIAGARNPPKGRLSTAHQAWIKQNLQGWDRPFLLGAHHSIKALAVDNGTAPLAEFLRAASPNFRGFIHGHDHLWKRDLCVWTDPAARPLLSLPCNGLWGDIGYVIFKTTPEKGVATLVQHDFYLHDPLPPGQERAAWTNRLQDNRGERCTFAL